MPHGIHSVTSRQCFDIVGWLTDTKGIRLVKNQHQQFASVGWLIGVQRHFERAQTSYIVPQE